MNISSTEREIQSRTFDDQYNATNSTTMYAGSTEETTRDEQFWLAFQMNDRKVKITKIQNLKLRCFGVRSIEDEEKNESERARESEKENAICAQACHTT